MQNTNEWILNNIALVIVLNIVLGGIFVYIVVRHIYKLIKKQRITPIEWAVFITSVALGVVVFMLTGMDDSTISL